MSGSMLTLALEHSTSTGSAALLRDEGILASDCWHDLTLGQRQLLSVVERILNQTGHCLSDIDLFAVGTGPGAYTNLRTSLSTAQGFALPESRPVRGISSAKALARDLALAWNAERITIVGNARRGRLWMMQFDGAAGDIEIRTEMTLVEPKELHGRLVDDEILATPDWDSIGGTLHDQKIPSCRLIEHPCTPHAKTVGVLAFQTRGVSQHAPPAPLAPMYIYPPVLVKQRLGPT